MGESEFFFHFHSEIPGKRNARSAAVLVLYLVYIVCISLNAPIGDGFQRSPPMRGQCSTHRLTTNVSRVNTRQLFGKQIVNNGLISRQLSAISQNYLDGGFLAFKLSCISDEAESLAKADSREPIADSQLPVIIGQIVFFHTESHEQENNHRHRCPG